MTATPIFDELVAIYLTEGALAGAPARRASRTPDEAEPQWPAAGALEQWWSHCEWTAG